MFEEIVQQYQKMIYHFIHKYQLQYEFDEYYQLALIKLWELHLKYDPEKTPNKNLYIYTKLNFYFIDEIRKLAKQSERYIVTEDHFLDSITNDDHSRLLLQSLQDILNENEWAWLNLKLTGYNMREIAAQLNVSTSSIKNYKRSAMRKLKNALENT